MKICPKCGQEFEGSSCPRCTGPEIIVNNNDYLQRKKAYEEKQARKKSASSDSDAAGEAPDLEAVFSKIKQSGTAAAKTVQGIGAKSKKSRKSSGNSAGGKLGLKETEEPLEEETNSSQKGVLSTRKKKWNKKIILIASLVVIMLLITAGTYGVYKLVTRKNYTLYMSYNSKIYDAASLDSTFVCNLDDAVFAADQKTFYKAEWPEGVDKQNLSESCVSQNGKYFAAVTYDEDSLFYTLTVWSEDGSIDIASSKNQKNIKTVTDSGVIIYTDTEVVNDQGYVGAKALYVYTTYLDKSQEKGSQLAGNVEKVESNLYSAYVYSDSETIVCFNTSSKLYTYNYKKNEKSKAISSVDLIYPMSGETAHLYVSQTSDENLLSDADSLVYLSGGVYYYLDIEDDSTITIGKTAGTNLSFIYEKKNDSFYMISSGSVKYAEVKDGKAGTFSEVDQLGTLQNMLYIDDDDRLVYVNASGQLMSANKGSKKVLKDQVEDGTLTLVGNTGDGITYITDHTQFYRSSVTASEISIYSENSLLSTKDTYLYKNHLYFYNNEKELYSCTQKGKDVNKIGQVDSLWLGTELK